MTISKEAITSILLPPLSVYWNKKPSKTVVLNAVLTLLGWVPGAIHAMIVNIKEKERSLVITNCHQTLLGFIFNPQILLIESCISPNMLVAPITKIIMLTTVPTKLFPER